MVIKFLRRGFCGISDFVAVTAVVVAVWLRVGAGVDESVGFLRFPHKRHDGLLSVAMPPLLPLWYRHHSDDGRGGVNTINTYSCTAVDTKSVVAKPRTWQ